MNAMVDRSAQRLSLAGILISALTALGVAYIGVISQRTASDSQTSLESAAKIDARINANAVSIAHLTTVTEVQGASIANLRVIVENTTRQSQDNREELIRLEGELEPRRQRRP